MKQTQLRRASGRRPGSILIMVVGLLVLLALIGTAFLSSSRTDRTASIQGVNQAQLDLIVQGVEQMAKAAIAGGASNPIPPNVDMSVVGMSGGNTANQIFNTTAIGLPTGSTSLVGMMTQNQPANILMASPFQFRPKLDEFDLTSPTVAFSAGQVPLGPQAMPGTNWDMPDLRHLYTNSIDNYITASNARFMPAVDGWLSPRCPQVAWTTAYTPYKPANLSLPPVTDPLTSLPLPAWLCIGKPLIGDHFDSPFLIANNALQSGPTQYYARMDPDLYTAAAGYSLLLPANPAPLTGVGVNKFIPQFVQMPGSPSTWFPAWFQTTGFPGAAGAAAYYVLAGDADGDGIADCGMFKLPTNAAGLTWYAGVRIIDNNSAVNVNTAWDRDHEFDGSGSSATPQPAPGVNTVGTLSGSAALNFYRLGLAPFTVAQGLSTADVGLQQLLHTWQPLPQLAANIGNGSNTVGGPGEVDYFANGNLGEMSNLNEFRFNNKSLFYTAGNGPLGGGTNGSSEFPGGVINFTALTNTYATASQPVDEFLNSPTAAPEPTGTFPRNSAQYRSDFWYLTMGDALQNILSRRLNNPGNVTAGSDSGSITVQAQRYGIEDSAALAYHFVMLNPATISPELLNDLQSTAYNVMPRNIQGADKNRNPVTTYGYGITSSQIERDLYRSVFDTAPNSPFPVYQPSTIPAPPASQTVFQSLLRNSGQSQYLPALFAAAGAGTYASSATVAVWFRDNFQFQDEAAGGTPNTASYQPYPVASISGSTNPVFPVNFKPRRALLTADSATSNLMPWVDPPLFNPSNRIYNTNADSALYNSFATLTINARPDVLNYVTYNAATKSYSPVFVPKANPNTSSFADLWRAFWGVMANSHAVTTGPAGLVTGTHKFPPYSAYTQSPYGGARNDGTNTSILSPVYEGRMFNNPAAVSPTFASPQTPLNFPPNVSSPALAPVNPSPTQCMFCSSIRDNHHGITITDAYDELNPDQMMLLRSALAAQNDVIMRDPLHGRLPTTSGGPNAYYFNGDMRHVVHLGLTTRGGSANGPGISLDAVVYGMMQNPYITEVYVNTDDVSNGPTNKPNPHGYFALELFNPYAFSIPLSGWQLAVVTRGYGAGMSTKRTAYFSFPPGSIIPANADPKNHWRGGYAVVENFAPAATYSDAVYRPAPVANGAYQPYTAPSQNPFSTLPTAANQFPVADIYCGPGVPPTPPPPDGSTSVYLPQGLFTNGGATASAVELVLLRPVAFTNNGGASGEFVPVDSFDFTGLQGLASKNGGIATGWHYARPNSPPGYPMSPNTNNTDTWAFSMPGSLPPNAFGTLPSNFLDGNLWRFLYPGRYMGSVALQRQQGTRSENWDTSKGQIEPWTTTPPGVGPVLEPTVTIGTPNDLGSYPAAFPFRYLDDGQPGPNPMRAALANGNPPNLPPFGGFARDADMAQIPFVGSYSFVQYQLTNIQLNGGRPRVFDFYADVLDYNTVTSDLAMAEDTDPGDDPVPDYVQTQPPAQQTAAEFVQYWHEEIGRFCPIHEFQVQPVIYNQAGGGTGSMGKSDGPYFAGLAPPPSPPPVANVTIDDMNITGQYHPQTVNGVTIGPAWRYRWATRLFDFLTTQTPHEDYLPNVDQTAFLNPYLDYQSAGHLPLGITVPSPVSNSGLDPMSYNAIANVSGQGTATQNAEYWNGFNKPEYYGTKPGLPGQYPPAPPSSVSPTTPNNIQQSLSVQGKININTANWRVLSTLPWVPPGEPPYQATFNNQSAAANTTGIQIDNNVELAQIICDWRDGTNYTGQNTSYAQLGPFRSIYDLYAIKPLYTYYGYLLATHEPSPMFGDQLGPSLDYFNPFSSDGYSLNSFPTGFQGPINTFATDGVRNDFEEKNNMLSRLSNLITTRSDTFTVYIVVQGWKNAGSADPLNPPQMVIQKRSAFFCDRSQMMSPGDPVKIYRFPND